MDPSASAENSKKKKVSEGQSNPENEDRISQLPESVLHYVLSFTPIKLAVRTSVLSTSWRHLWASIHNLDFDDEMHFKTKKLILSKKKSFFDFVDRVFRINVVSKIHRLSINCKDYDVIRLGKWISIAMERKVQELIFCIKSQHSRHPYRLPVCLFVCESLRVLKIEMDASINLPATVCFSSLKVLHLIQIGISCNQSTKGISVSCPVLEEFLLYHCRWLEIKLVNISAPTLERLTIDEYVSREDSHDCQIVFDAKSLKSFKLVSNPSYDYTFCHLSSLVNVYLDLYGFNRGDALVRNVTSLLSGIYNVKDLELHGNTIETISIPTLSAHVHSLSSLVHLRVSRSNHMIGKKLIDLLCNIPTIETLSFPRGLDSFGFQGNGRILGTTPQSFLSRLKLVNINSFRGIRNQRWFIKFLIKSVRAVEKWTINFPENLDQRTTAELEELAKYSNCVLGFQLKR